MIQLFAAQSTFWDLFIFIITYVIKNILNGPQRAWIVHRALKILIYDGKFLTAWIKFPSGVVIFDLYAPVPGWNGYFCKKKNDGAERRGNLSNWIQGIYQEGQWSELSEGAQEVCERTNVIYSSLISFA